MVESLERKLHIVGSIFSYKIIHILNDEVISNSLCPHSYVNTCIYDTYAWEDNGEHTNNIGYHQEHPHIHKINHGILHKCE